jgi:hypothetical protein
MLGVIMQNVIMLSVHKLSVDMLSVDMLSVVMLRVVMLNVLAPFLTPFLVQSTIVCNKLWCSNSLGCLLSFASVIRG